MNFKKLQKIAETQNITQSYCNQCSSTGGESHGPDCSLDKWVLIDRKDLKILLNVYQVMKGMM